MTATTTHCGPRDEGQDLTIADLAAAIKAHNRTIRAALKSGRIRGYRIGRAWRITRAELDRIRREGVSA